jgi:hypothetical protein
MRMPAGIASASSSRTSWFNTTTDMSIYEVPLVETGGEA